MSSTETQPSTPAADSKPISKQADDSVISLLTQVSKQNSDAIADLSKKVGDLAADVKKAIEKPVEKTNPVAPGVEQQNIPKVQDATDVGDKVTIQNNYGEAKQASIIAPAGNPTATDASGVAQVVKEEKKEEKKEDEKVEKSQEKFNKGFNYVVAETVRPRIFQKTHEGAVPTGYQILKAIENGWNGQFAKADDSFAEAMRRLEIGEFGTGNPVGVY